MNQQQDNGGTGAGQGVRTVTVEIITALVMVGGGLLLIADAVRLGNGWEADGPQAGFYPFYIGLLLCGSAGFIALQNIRKLRTDRHVFVEPGHFRLVLAMLVPSLVYVGVIYLLGIYLASALFLVFFMVWQGGYSIVRCLPVALGVPAVAFALFELWFRVPLPKGPVEALFGF